MSTEEKQQDMDRGDALCPQDGAGGQDKKGNRGAGAGAGMATGGGVGR